MEREEGDPSPCEAIEPPDLLLADERDPDAAFRWSCGYAAQVIVLDACLEGLCQLLDDSSDVDRWLIVLCGVRGFPLGEHGRIGGVDDRLFAEQLHVPLVWRFPDGTGRLARGGQLTSHLDVLPTILDWVARDARPSTGGSVLDGRSCLPRTGDSTLSRDALLAAGITGQRSIRTAGWSLRCEPVDDHNDHDEQASAESTSAADDNEWHRELYVRPDDRWEANDVANLCPDVVEALGEVLRDASQRLSRGEPLPARILPAGMAASAE
jgi:arylsulfatase A-like enzyme